MQTAFSSNDLPLVETMALPDVFVSGMAGVEPVGGNCYRFTWYVTQRNPTSGETERVVVAKIICSADVVQSICELALRSVRVEADETPSSRAGALAH